MEGDDIINAIRSRHKSREEYDKGFGIDISESTLRHKDEFDRDEKICSKPSLSVFIILQTLGIGRPGTSTSTWNASSM